MKNYVALLVNDVSETLPLNRETLCHVVRNQDKISSVEVYREDEKVKEVNNINDLIDFLVFYCCDQYLITLRSRINSLKSELVKCIMENDIYVPIRKIKVKNMERSFLEMCCAYE